MNVRYVVYSITSGEILREGIATADMVAYQAYHEGESAMVVGEGVSSETHLIVDGEVVLKDE